VLVVQATEKSNELDKCKIGQKTSFMQCSYFEIV